MKTFSRIIAVMLLAVLIVSVLSACDNNNDETDSSAVSDSVSKENELFWNLPKNDYNDEEIVILVEGDGNENYKSREIAQQEDSPEVLNTNITTRNSLVEEAFGVKITEVRTDSTNEMVTLIRENAISGTDSYDLVMPYMRDASILAGEDSFYCLDELENMHLSEPYWDQHSINDLSIYGKNYFVTGDISLLSLACTHAIVFNRDMVTDYQLEDPIQLVKDGKWTIDKLEEMAKKVTSDSDGVTGMSYTDTYGFLINNNFVTSMFIGGGQRLTTKDEDDKPIISVKGDAATSVFDRIYNLVNEPTATGQIDGGTYSSSATAAGKSVWLAATESVANKKALFRAMAVIDIYDLGDYECNFGLLPVPKYNEAQQDYFSCVSTLYATCLAIPTSNPDPETASIIADALCQASTKTTKYAYYDVVLSYQKIKDDASQEMLNKIFDSRVYDLGIVYHWGGATAWDTGSISSFMNQVAFSGSQTFVSSFAAIEGSVQAAIDETLSQFE